MDTPSPRKSQGTPQAESGLVQYSLPFRVGASQYEQVEALINQVSKHTQYLRVSMFFTKVADLLDEKGVFAINVLAHRDATEDWVETSVDSAAKAPDSPNGSMDMKLDGELSHEVQDLVPQDLSVDIEASIIDFINENAQGTTAQDLRRLALEVWPNDLRALMDATHLEQSIPPASSRKAPGNRF